jgi:hypothetical protein
MGMARISTMQDQVEERALLHGGTVFEFAVFVLFSPIDSLVPVFRLSQEISEANAAALASSRGCDARQRAWSRRVPQWHTHLAVESRSQQN